MEIIFELSIFNWLIKNIFFFHVEFKIFNLETNKQNN